MELAVWGQGGSLYFKWRVRESRVTFGHRIKILKEVRREITRWRSFQVGRSPRACAQVGEVRMTGEQGCQTRQLAGLSQLPTPLCLLSSWARSLSSLLHTRRTVIVLHTVVERIKSENL